MYKILSVLCFFLVFNLQLEAQKKSDFNILPPNIKVGDSKYSKLHYIEARENPDDMGFAYVNSWNGVQAITLSSSIEVQLQSLVGTVVLPSDEGKTIAVQMRILFFDAGNGRAESKSKCNLRMTLYEMDDNGNYYFLNTLDSIVISGRKDIKANASMAITSFIVDNLPYSAEEGEKALDINAVMDIDMYEKNSLPFYTEVQIPNGIYRTYKSLMNLVPDSTPDLSIIANEEGMVKEVKFADPQNTGKDKKLKTKDVYAIAVDGIPYFNFDGDFYKAYNKDGYWRFIISQKVGGSGFTLGIGIGGGGRHAAGGVGFGIPIGGKKEYVEMLIDHLNGDSYWGDRVSK